MPVDVVPGSQTVYENSTLTLSSGNSNALSIGYVDASGGATVQVTLTVSNGTLTLSTTSGLNFSFSDSNGVGTGSGTADATMTFRGTVADINAALNGMVYTPTADFNGADSIEMLTDDLGDNSSGSPLTADDLVEITVNPMPSTTSVSADVSSPVYGQTVTLTATVAAGVGFSGTPTGTVDFYDGATWIGSGTLSVVGGYDVATFGTSALSLGDHASITAVYEGDSNYNTSTSSATDVDVGQDGTSTSVGADNNPSVYGQTVTFTATVSAASPGSGTPTGTVQFQIDDSDYGSPVSLNGSGQATITDAALSVGSHSVTAIYSGDGNFTASDDTGSPLSQTVNKASTTTTVGVTLIDDTFTDSNGTDLASHTADTGQTWEETNTFTIESDEAVGAGVPYATADIPVSGVSGNWTMSCQITIDTTTDGSQGIWVSDGSHAYHFWWDGNFTATDIFAITDGYTTYYNQTGYITVTPGTPRLFQVDYISGTFYFTVTGPGMSAPVSLSYTPSGLGAITNFGIRSGVSSTVAFDNFCVTLPTTTPAVYGDPLTFTAQVAPASPGNGDPTGSVDFYDAQTYLGSGTLLDGVATYSTSTLSVGDHIITAVYAGDSNFITSTSSDLDQTIT